MNRIIAAVLLGLGFTALGCQNAPPVGRLLGGTAAAHAREQSLLQSPPAEGPPRDPNDLWAGYAESKR